MGGRPKRRKRPAKQQPTTTTFSTRPDLLQTHTAILLAAFLDAGLSDALTQLSVTQSDPYLCVRATALIGELAEVASQVLPPARHSQLTALPALLAITTSQESTLEQRSRAKLAANYLEKVDEQQTDFRIEQIEQTNQGQANQGQTNQCQTNQGQTNQCQTNQGQTNQGSGGLGDPFEVPFTG